VSGSVVGRGGRGAAAARAARCRDLVWRRVTKRAGTTMLPVNIWYPALFISTGHGYHRNMLPTKVFRFAGGAESKLGGARRGRGWMPRVVWSGVSSAGRLR
jgi:hypothetical protein